MPYYFLHARIGAGNTIYFEGEFPNEREAIAKANENWKDYLKSRLIKKCKWRIREESTMGRAI